MVRSRSKSSKHPRKARPIRADELARLMAELQSADGQTRHNARLALVEIGPPAVQPLIEALASPADDLRWEAAKALSEIVDPSAAPALVSALEDKSFGVRWLAAEGLIALRRSALPPLLLALTQRSSSIWLRRGAHHVLHDLALSGFHDQVASVIEALEDVEPITQVPPAAWAALQQLPGGRHQLARP